LAIVYFEVQLKTYDMTCLNASQACGSHWEHKMKTFFNCLEQDGDGIITAKDFDLVASRWAQAGNMNAEDTEKFRQEYARIYTTYFHPEGGNQNFEGFSETDEETHKGRLPERNQPFPEEVF